MPLCWAGHEERIRYMRNVHNILIVKPEEKNSAWVGTLYWILKSGFSDSSDLGQKSEAGSCEHGRESSVP